MNERRVSFGGSIFSLGGRGMIVQKRKGGQRGGSGARASVIIGSKKVS